MAGLDAIRLSGRQLLLALGVIGIFALAVPAGVATAVNAARIDRAGREVAAIAQAVARFRQDLGTLPRWPRAGDRRAGVAVDLLVGPGRVPGDGPLTGVRVDSLANQLVSNAPEYARVDGGGGWKGPYLTEGLEPDPWGNRYLVLFGTAPTTLPSGSTAWAWAVSAGPNGRLETDVASAADLASGGDDIVTRIR